MAAWLVLPPLNLLHLNPLLQPTLMMKKKKRKSEEEDNAE
jgi:hypothetical protein